MSTEELDTKNELSIEELTDRPDYAVWEDAGFRVYTHGGKGKVMLEVSDEVSFEVDADYSEVVKLLREHGDDADRVRGDDDE